MNKESPDWGFLLFQEPFYIFRYSIWGDSRSISSDHLSISIDEKFREVPLDSTREPSSLLRLEVLVEWMCVISIHIYLREEWKCDSKINLT